MAWWFSKIHLHAVNHIKQIFFFQNWIFLSFIWCFWSRIWIEGIHLYDKNINKYTVIGWFEGVLGKYMISIFIYLNSCGIFSICGLEVGFSLFQVVNFCFVSPWQCFLISNCLTAHYMLITRLLAMCNWTQNIDRRLNIWLALILLCETFK